MNHHRPPPNIWTAVGLLIAFAGPPALVAAERRIVSDAPGIGVQTFMQLIFCGLAVAVLFIVLRGERLPLRSERSGRIPPHS